MGMMTGALNQVQARKNTDYWFRTGKVAPTTESLATRVEVLEKAGKKPKKGPVETIGAVAAAPAPRNLLTDVVDYPGLAEKRRKIGSKEEKATLG